MKTVVLCGGKGTRLNELTDKIPKPLIQIGDKPILWHIMNMYRHYGHNDFILCLGYKGEEIRSYFRNETKFKITFVDTGIDTNKAERIKMTKDLEENLEKDKPIKREKPEKEMVREVIIDVSLGKTSMPIGGLLAVSDDTAQKAAYALKEKEHQQIVERLIGLAFAQGLAIAVKAANHLKNPHLLDEFHDALADKYYEKLLAARKLKA